MHDDSQPRVSSDSLDGVAPFDAHAIAAYAGDHVSVYDYIDEHIHDHVDQLRAWVQQPSISALDEGITEMAELVRSDLVELGFHETEIVPTSGHPGVWGYYDAGAEKTLLVYLMYDVQPADEEGWSAEPFEASLVDNELGTVMMGRGVIDAKGPERAFLNAVESIIAVDGTLPVNLMVTAEGEEELGSPHYPELIDRFESRLRSCEAAIFPFTSQNSQGIVNLVLGVKGILYLEIEARGGSGRGPQYREIGGSLKVLVDSPAWRLVQALASLVSMDGNVVQIPGFDEAIRPPTDEELRLAAGMVAGWTEREQVVTSQAEVQRGSNDVDGVALLMRHLFDSPFNIDGIWAGWTGPGTKTVVPSVATAKVDVRLVPDQRPEDVLELVRSHFTELGFGDLEIRVLAAYPPAQVSVEAPIVKSMISVFNKYGHVPTVPPRTAGSAPLYVFTERLGLPILHGGLGHGGGAHASDEYMVIHPPPGHAIAGLAEVEKSYVDLLYAFGES